MLGELTNSVPGSLFLPLPYTCCNYRIDIIIILYNNYNYYNNYNFINVSSSIYIAWTNIFTSHVCLYSCYNDTAKIDFDRALLINTLMFKLENGLCIKHFILSGTLYADKGTMKHLNTFISRCTVNTQVGEAVVAPDPHPQVTHAVPWGLPSKCMS